MLFPTVLLGLLVGPSVATYTLEDDYVSGGNFFSLFTFFTGADPTNGFVDYVSQSTAQSSGLISQSSTNVHIGTDSTNVTPNGRPSVRISSNKSYNSGSLVILDLEHMPGGACGTWPAFWMLGPDWPSHGEIDIIEGVNEQTTNQMTLHTANDCTISNDGDFTGTITTSNCYIDASGQSNNAGCGISTTNTKSFGAGFNANNGGVYAMEFGSSAISVFFFPRGSIPSDIPGGTPNPATWGEPMAQFQGACDIPNVINEQQIIFDLTYCGDFAGAVWPSSPCASQASTCNDFVENNPSAFSNMFWSINSLKVYQSSGSSKFRAARSDARAFAPLAVAPAVNATSAATESPELAARNAGRKSRNAIMSRHLREMKKHAAGRL